MWLTALLQQQVFKHYTANNAELRRLARRVSAWLADANFCLELAEIDGLGQVPLSTQFDIFTSLHFGDIMAYRTVPLSGTIAQVVRLGGADANIRIPSFLLPHVRTLEGRLATSLRSSRSQALDFMGITGPQRATFDMRNIC